MTVKRLFKKNQIVVTALALMIAAAGYLNYSGKLFPDKEKEETQQANAELLDISDEDASQTSGDIESLDQDAEAADGEVEGNPGEAVLTSGEVKNTVAQAKVSREQVRAKNKETLQSIIDSTSVSDDQKEDAIQQMLDLTKIAEQESAAETLLASKGFSETVVTVSDGKVDVVVGNVEMTDVNRAQIEDIVTRKTGVSPENIIISPIHKDATKDSTDDSKEESQESTKEE
ncbi:stage III sporulation protein AH [Drancourtella sp. An177]|nr:stage III sporulation protein AH [Drancourtella sp. An177]